MPTDLTPSERSTRARLAALAKHRQTDPHEATKAACRANPSSLEYWETKIDPDHELTAKERARRADLARREHFTRLALKSAKARRRKRAAS
jgi:hypothetical protein